ncbi:MAG: hypothetical protein NTU81_00650 [Candidatus Nomurabacteria bacterium]|nr:hypothetical protein [Candidatus Nomurabacteria bacterium]
MGNLKKNNCPNEIDGYCLTECDKERYRNLDIEDCNKFIKLSSLQRKKFNNLSLSEQNEILHIGLEKQEAFLKFKDFKNDFNHEVTFSEWEQAAEVSLRNHVSLFGPVVPAEKGEYPSAH